MITYWSTTKEISRLVYVSSNQLQPCEVICISEDQSTCNVDREGLRMSGCQDPKTISLSFKLWHHSAPAQGHCLSWAHCVLLTCRIHSGGRADNCHMRTRSYPRVYFWPEAARAGACSETQSPLPQPSVTERAVTARALTLTARTARSRAELCST